MCEKDARSLVTAQEGQKRAEGIDYKQQQGLQAEDEAKARRRAELISSILNTIDELTRAGRTSATPVRLKCRWPAGSMVLCRHLETCAATAVTQLGRPS
jgi:molecular chaperone GrpE (heat shock protein)